MDFAHFRVIIMPYIQENRTRSYWNGEKIGKKAHSRFSITIPREIVKFMGWKRGDELEFKLEKRKVVLRKRPSNLVKCKA
ncbi:MAG: AbrB/MazE/SpoVT family DNA-binding domain-containing protein [Candidatus Hodarchaeota archaeon]